MAFPRSIIFSASASVRIALVPLCPAIARKLQQRLIHEHRQISICHLCHEGDLRAAPVLLEGEVLLQVGVIEAADAAKEIQFEVGEANARGVGTRDNAPFPGSRAAGQRGRKHTGAQALGFLRGVGRDRRKQLGALDTVASLRGFDIQCGDAQVAVFS